MLSSERLYLPHQSFSLVSQRILTMRFDLNITFVSNLPLTKPKYPRNVARSTARLASFILLGRWRQFDLSVAEFTSTKVTLWRLSKPPDTCTDSVRTCGARGVITIANFVVYVLSTYTKYISPQIRRLFVRYLGDTKFSRYLTATFLFGI